MAEEQIYGAHPDIARMARKEFADHKMRRGPGYSWRLAKPGTGIYSFRVTWAPGVVMVSGDIGNATYQVWPSFGTLWEAVDLIHDAGHDYLTGRSGVVQEFDRDGTVTRILAEADERMKCEDFGLWEKIAKRYDWRDSGSPRSGAYQMKLAARLREDDELEPNELWRWLGEDADLTQYQDSVSTRWHYEAVTLWARMVLAAEPRWHFAWRRSRAEWARLKRLRRHVLYRPAIVHLEKLWLSGSRDWTRCGDRWCAIYPVRMFGFDLSRFGLWAASGSSMRVGDRAAGVLEKAAANA